MVPNEGDEMKLNFDNYDNEELEDDIYDYEQDDDEYEDEDSPIDEEEYEYVTPWYIKFGKILIGIVVVFAVLLAVRFFTGGGSHKTAFLSEVNKQFNQEKLAKKYDVTMTKKKKISQASGVIMVSGKQANITFKTNKKEHTVLVDGDKVYQNKKELDTKEAVSAKETNSKSNKSLEEFLTKLDDKHFTKTDKGYELTLSTDETKELFSILETKELKQFKLYKNHIAKASKLETKVLVNENETNIKVDYKNKEAFKLDITVSDTKFKEIKPKTKNKETKASSSSVDISSITKSSSSSSQPEPSSTEQTSEETESQAIQDLRTYLSNDADGFTEDDQRVIDHQKELEKRAE